MLRNRREFYILYYYQIYQATIYAQLELVPVLALHESDKASSVRMLQKKTEVKYNYIGLIRLLFSNLNSLILGKKHARCPECT